MATVRVGPAPRRDDDQASSADRRVRDAIEQLLRSHGPGRGIRDAIEQVKRELEAVQSAEPAPAAGALTARISHAVAGLQTSWGALKALPWRSVRLSRSGTATATTPADRQAAVIGPTRTAHPVAIDEPARLARIVGPGLVIARAPRYQLGERLGAGGMAEVFRGWQVGADGFERTVAIKRIAPQLVHRDRYRALFNAEACTTARLSHPNIVSALDFVKEGDETFLVLEYVDGIDLGKLSASGPVSPSVILFLAAELLSGLGYVHHLPANGSRALGVVHRDLSPSNILLSWDGAVKISDFGIAKRRTETEVSASRHPEGKEGYMSPEQLRGQPLDGRADLFSLGVVLWEMLAGRRMYPHAPATVLSDRPPRPSEFRDVPRDLERVVMKLLRRRREQRYPTAEAAFDALAGCDSVSALRGRVELVELLAQRFPREAGYRATRCPPLPHTPTPTITTSALKPKRAPVRERYRWWRRQRRWARQRRRARRLIRRQWSGIAIAAVGVLVLVLVLRVVGW